MRPRRLATGFTLLEVLVALAILSLAVVASIEGFAQGLRLLKLSGDHQEAMLLADQKLREVLNPEEGREAGEDGQFRWERTTRLLPAPDLVVASGPPRWRAYEIDVRVVWGERRQVEVATLRTVPTQTQTPQTQPAQPGGPPAPPAAGQSPGPAMGPLPGQRR